MDSDDDYSADEYEYEYSDDEDDEQEDEGVGNGGKTDIDNNDSNDDDDDNHLTGTDTVRIPSSSTTTTTTSTPSSNQSKVTPSSSPTPNQLQLQNQEDINPRPSWKRIRKNPSSRSLSAGQDPCTVTENSVSSFDSSSSSLAMLQRTNQTIDIQMLIPFMNQRTNDVSEMFCIPPEAVVCLLQHFQWNQQTATERFMENSTKIQNLVGITHRCCSSSNSGGDHKDDESSSIRTNDHQSGVKSMTSMMTTDVDCLICMDTVSINDAMKMPCGHEFCRDCWFDYLNNGIVAEGATCTTLTCPDATCNERVTEREVKTVVPQDVLNRYKEYQLNDFAQAMGRWCPGPGCGRICLTNRSENPTIGSCGPCNIQFCTSCSVEPHAPATCEQIQTWNEKDQAEAQTASWVKDNTKQCPKCAARIEKNGGCQYIVCQKCKTGFCWVCGGTHHVWNCNSFKEKEADNGNEEVRKKNELERYIHYLTRYAGHHDGQHFAKRQLERVKRFNETAIEDRMDVGTNVGGHNTPSKSSVSSSTAEGGNTMSMMNDPLEDLPEYLIEANQQVVVCRRVLKYTYIFAFFFFEDPKRAMGKEVFETHQGQLERLTEGLSGEIEKNVKDMNQADVINQTRVIGKFIQNVLGSVEEMLDDDE